MVTGFPDGASWYYRSANTRPKMDNMKHTRSERLTR